MTFHDNFFSCSVDDWESKQAGWTQTAKVLKHFAEDVTLSNQMFELQVYTFVFCVQIQLGPNGIEFRKSD